MKNYSNKRMNAWSRKQDKLCNRGVMIAAHYHKDLTENASRESRLFNEKIEADLRRAFCNKK